MQYCNNDPCAAEAVGFYLTEKGARMYLCATCYAAFELGQINPEATFEMKIPEETDLHRLTLSVPGDWNEDQRLDLLETINLASKLCDIISAGNLSDMYLSGRDVDARDVCKAIAILVPELRPQLEYHVPEEPETV